MSINHEGKQECIEHHATDHFGKDGSLNGGATLFEKGRGSSRQSIPDGGAGFQ